MSVSGDDDELVHELPGRVVACGYVLAGLCALLPMAVVGAAFAALVLAQRGRRADGLAIVALAVACTAVGIALR